MPDKKKAGQIMTGLSNGGARRDRTADLLHAMQALWPTELYPQYILPSTCRLGDRATNCATGPNHKIFYHERSDLKNIID